MFTIALAALGAGRAGAGLAGGAPPAQVADAPAVASEPLAPDAGGSSQDTKAVRKSATVLITAQRRVDPLANVPPAVSAFTADELDRRGYIELADLARAVPNLDINRFGVANPSHAAIFLRGVGVQDHIITTDPAVGLYLDGVYLGRQMGANLRLAGLERAEVLRGPQGTLYGRNTLGGAVNLITREPGDQPQRRLEFKFGSLGRIESSLFVDQRLDERWGLSLSALASHRNGVGQARLVDAPREVGEENEAGMRLGVKLRLGSGATAVLRVDAARGDNGKSPSTIEIHDPAGYFPSQLGLSEAMLPTDPDDSNSGQAELLRQTHRGSGLALTLRWQAAPGWQARLIASRREGGYTGGLDDDHTLADWVSFPERGQASQLTAEFQLAGRLGPLDLVTGAFAGREVGWTNSGPWVYIGPGGHFEIRQSAQTAALYAHARWPLGDGWQLGAGLRHSNERKRASAQFDSWADPTPVQRVGRWSAPTGELSLSRPLRPGLVAHASLASGFQSGGFPPRPFGGPEMFAAFAPTRALNVELGLKGRLAPGLEAQLALFRTRYSDWPLQVSAPSGAGYATVTDNAGVAVAQGLELEGTWRPLPGFELRAALGLIDARMTQVPASASSVDAGDRLPLTASHTLSLAPRKVWQLAGGDWVEAALDLSWRSAAWGQLANSPANRLDPRRLVNLHLGYTPPQGRWSLALYGRNLLDDVYDLARLDSAFAGFTDVIRSNDRREFGLRLGLRL